LLLLGLLAAPAAAAHHLTDRPFRGLALSACLAVAATWAGLAISYLFPATPPSFAIVAVATAMYGAAAARSTVLPGVLRRSLRGGSRRNVPRSLVGEEIEHA